MFSRWQLINEARLHCALPRFYALTELLQEAIGTPTATQIPALYRSHPAVAAAILCHYQWPCQGFCQGNGIFPGFSLRVMCVAASLLIGIWRTFKSLGTAAIALLWPVPVRGCTLRGSFVSQFDDRRASIHGRKCVLSSCLYGSIRIYCSSDAVSSVHFPFRTSCKVRYQYSIVMSQCRRVEFISKRYRAHLPWVCSFEIQHGRQH